jgi:hypothetical protein
MLLSQPGHPDGQGPFVLGDGAQLLQLGKAGGGDVDMDSEGVAAQ